MSDLQSPHTDHVHVEVGRPKQKPSNGPCPVCGRDNGDHDFKKHREARRSPKEGEESNVRQGVAGFDPVLRVALVNAGVITEQDLRNAETLVLDMRPTSAGRGNQHDSGTQEG